MLSSVLVVVGDGSNAIGISPFDVSVVLVRKIIGVDGRLILRCGKVTTFRSRVLIVRERGGVGGGTFGVYVGIVRFKSELRIPPRRTTREERRPLTSDVIINSSMSRMHRASDGLSAGRADEPRVPDL